MDIGSKRGYPSSALSNFAPHPFIFEGVPCASMEGFLQSLKFDKPHIQAEVCKLVGIGAKRRGKDRNTAWKVAQKLWWCGTAYDRHGSDYQALLDRAYIALTQQHEGFRKALLASQDAVLIHTIGRSKESETVLTQSEFCSRLTKLRELLKREADLHCISHL
jgi:predicted NAD-dependent protein-ADP-ribosyltransferase YbiA (DUF1768 family)